MTQYTKAEREDLRSVIRSGDRLVSDSGGGVQLARPRRPTIVKGMMLTSDPIPIAGATSKVAKLPDLSPIRQRIDDFEVKVRQVTEAIRAGRRQ